MQLKNTKEGTDVLEPSKRKNFFLRTISSLILAPFCLFLLWKGGFYTSILMGFISFLVLFEWIKLCLKTDFSVLLKILWLTSGVIYIGLSLAAFWSLTQEPGGNYLLMAYVILALASDTGGYVFGMVFKGPKLAPKISPNKTWSGTLGALCLTWIIAHGIFYYSVGFNLKDLWLSGAIAMAISSVCQLGDLLQSWVKRRFKVKDTGHLIPGHGGILDRVDGLLAVGLLILCFHLMGS